MYTVNNVNSREGHGGPHVHVRVHSCAWRCSDIQGGASSQIRFLLTYAAAATTVQCITSTTSRTRKPGQKYPYDGRKRYFSSLQQASIPSMIYAHQAGHGHIAAAARALHNQPAVCRGGRAQARCSACPFPCEPYAALWSLEHLLL